MQAGYGVWYGDGSHRNYHSAIVAHEHQSISRAELRGVRHALLHRRLGERVVVVMDSEYVYKGIVEWSLKWRRHVWECSTREVGHADLWEQILWLWEEGGDHVQLRRVPSHLAVRGNEQADSLAEMGRALHPNNLLLLPRQRRVTEWDALGLEPVEDPAWELKSGDHYGESESKTFSMCSGVI